MNILKFIISLWKYNWCDKYGYTQDEIVKVQPLNKEFPIFLCQNCINKNNINNL